MEKEWQVKQLEVVAGIVVHEGKILCLQRGVGRYEYVSGKFEFPGGKVEPGETLVCALKRELLEELDLAVDVMDTEPYITVCHEYPDFTIRMHVLRCRIPEGPLMPVLTEHRAYRLLPPDELRCLDWAPADVPVVDKLMADDLRAQFRSPASEFGPMPFWFWNEEMTTERIDTQLRDFLDKGVTGFVLHPRIGMPASIPYLSDHFMSLVCHAVAFAAAHDMRVLLYDEAMYPSGSAHGLVVRENAAFASVGLRIEARPLPQTPGRYRISVAPGDGEKLVAVLAVLHEAAETGIDAAKTRILPVSSGYATAEVPESGCWSALLCLAVPSGGTIRGLHFGEDDGESGAPPSADLLNPEAVQTFLSLTHERYAQSLQPYFGTTVIGFFTDEPSILGRNALPDLLPWTGDFLLDWTAAGLALQDLALLRYDARSSASEEPRAFLSADMPETDMPETTMPLHASVRRRYRKAVSDRLGRTYYGALSYWCEKNGLALAGHPEGSMDIGVLSHFGIPGQDLVWRWVGPEEGKGLSGPHSTMAKSAADISRSLGHRRNANECFGCCGPDGLQWAFSADDMKWMLDWLFLRGTNLLIPHAFFSSVEGAGRYGERPPDVGPHNIWWPEYGTIAQYIRRMSWLRTDSSEVACVAVLCREDWVPYRSVASLYRDGIGFHYLLASQLCERGAVSADGRITAGNDAYDVVLVEEACQLPLPVRHLLSRFGTAGGLVLMGPETSPSLPEEIRRHLAVRNGGMDPLPRMVPACGELRLATLDKGGNRFLLATNEGDVAMVTSLILPLPRPLAGTTRFVEQWNPWTGEITRLAVSPERAEDGPSRDATMPFRIPVRLERRASLIFRIPPVTELADNTIPFHQMFHGEPIQDLSSEWTLSGGCLTTSCTLDMLLPWEEIPALKGYVGPLDYTRTFTIHPVPGERYLVDFGTVGELLRLRVNGQKADTCLWAPYQLDITALLRDGDNQLQATVVNSLVHRYEREAAQARMEALPRLRSGLIGPIRLMRQPCQTTEWVQYKTGTTRSAR